MEGLSVQKIRSYSIVRRVKRPQPEFKIRQPFYTRHGLAVFKQPHDCNFRLSHSRDVFWTPNERIIANALTDDSA